MTDDNRSGEGMQAQAGICKRCCDDHEGMTLRQWFAGMALGAVYTNYMEYSEKHGMDTTKGIECPVCGLMRGVEESDEK